MSYGVVGIPDMFRSAALLVGAILDVAKPAGMPTKFELIINLESASSLGLEILTILVRANAVIE
jgi:hypothetical protein